MNLQFLKNAFRDDAPVAFQFPDGKLVPQHFHVTEIAQVDKYFVDCGGKKRKSQYITIQLWHGDDFDHRVTSNTFNKIINSLDGDSVDSLEVFIEVQEQTISLYAIEEIIFYNAGKEKTQSIVFNLCKTKTNCLAPQKCGLVENRCKSNCC